MIRLGPVLGQRVRAQSLNGALNGCEVKTAGIYERPNGVNRQPSNDQNFNSQPSKKGNFYSQPSKEAVIREIKIRVYGKRERQK